LLTIKLSLSTKNDSTSGLGARKRDRGIEPFADGHLNGYNRNEGFVTNKKILKGFSPDLNKPNHRCPPLVLRRGDNTQERSIMDFDRKVNDTGRASKKKGGKLRQNDY